MNLLFSYAKSLKHPQNSPYLITAIVGYTLLLLFEVNPITAIFVVILIVIQVWSGNTLNVLVGKTLQTTVASTISFGFITGSVAITLCSQIFIHTPLHRLAWLIPAIFAFAFRVCGLVSQSRVVTQKLQTDNETLLIASGATLLFLSQDYTWCFPIFIIVTFAIFVYQLFNRVKQHRWNSSLFFLLLLIVGLCTKLILSILRDKYWWVLTNDFQFFEAIQRSTSRWGISNNWGALNENWYRYHSFTYVWMGSLDNALGLPHWTMIAHVGPPILSLVLAFSIIALYESFKLKTFYAKSLVLLTYPLLFFYSYISPSFVFGQIVLFAIVAFWVQNLLEDRRIVGPLLAMTMPFLLFYTKSSNLPTGAVVLGVLLSIQFFHIHRQTNIRNLFGAFLFGITSCLIILWVVAFNQGSSGSPKFFDIFGFSYERVGSLAALSSKLDLFLVATLILAQYFLFPIIGICVAFLILCKKERVYALILAPLTFYTAFLSVVTGQGANGYFVVSGLNVTYALTLIIVAKTSHQIVAKKNRFLLLFFGGVVGIGQTLLSNKLNNGTFGNLIFSSFLKSGLLLSLLFAIFFVLLKFAGPKNNSFNLRLSSVWLLIGLMGFTLGSGVLSLRNPIRGADVEVTELADYIGSTAEQNVAKWLNAHTPTDSLIASNHFCGKYCYGTEWYTLQPETAGSNFILPLYSDRRFVIQGTRFIGGQFPSKRIKFLMSSVIEFAELPTFSNLNNLLDLGVDYYVLDLDSTERAEWTTFPNPVFKNEQFLVIDLHDQASIFP
jgi:hypothetical protein